MSTATTQAPRRTLTRQGPYWLYLLPLAAGFLTVVAAPFAMNVYTSLFHWKGGQAPMRWAGLENYATLLTDATFWRSFQNSLAMIVAITIIPTIIGVLLAALLFDYLGRRFGDRAIAVLISSPAPADCCGTFYLANHPHYSPGLPHPAASWTGDPADA